MENIKYLPATSSDSLTMNIKLQRKELTSTVKVIDIKQTKTKGPKIGEPN